MQPITYPALRAAMKRQLEEALPGKYAQSLSNLNTALNQYLGGLAIPADAVVGTEFRSSYYKLIERHLANLAASGRLEQSIRDRKSLLKKWRSLFLKLDGELSSIQRTQSPFVGALTAALPEGISLKTIAKQASVPYSSLTRWRHGVLPTTRSLPALRRLERFFAMQHGQLTDFVAPSARVESGTAAPPRDNPYRERLKKQRGARYRLASASETLRSQWAEFIAYKTSPLLFDLRRSEKGIWSTSPLQPGAASMEKLWYARTDEGSFVPSAGISWGFVLAFLGWVSRQEASDEPLTLSLFTDLSLLNRYLSWYLKQAGGKFNGGHLRFVSFVLSLTHPHTGYLTQKPELRSRLNGEILAEQWADRCNAVYTKLKEHKKVIQKNMTKSRDPDSPVAPVLALENPMLAVDDMRSRLRARRPTAGTHTEAIWGRDLLLIGLMICSPLRANNLKHLTYRADNTGNLRQIADGSWQLEIIQEHFKNRSGAASKRKYHIELDPVLHADLEAYIRVFRPMLLRGNAAASDYLIVSGRPGSGNGPWEGLNRRFEPLTEKYLMQCPGVGPQAMRHIVATAIIKATGEFNTAALVLHDEEETIKRAYAHLRPEDGHTRYRKLFPGVFKG